MKRVECFSGTDQRYSRCLEVWSELLLELARGVDGEDAGHGDAHDTVGVGVLRGNIMAGKTGKFKTLVDALLWFNCCVNVHLMNMYITAEH